MRPAKEIGLEVARAIAAAHRRTGYIESSIIAAAIEARDREAVEACAQAVINESLEDPNEDNEGDEAYQDAITRYEVTRAELIELLRQHDVAMQFEIYGGRVKLREATAALIREAWNRRTPAAPPEAADLAITVRWTLGAWVWSVASDPPQSGESSSPSFAFDTALYCRNVIADGRNRDAAAAPGPAPASR